MKNTTQPVLNIIKLMLFCTSCVLGYTLWSELNRPIVLPVNAGIDNKSVITDNISLQETPYEVPEISNYDEIINRPLFFEDRQPFIYVEPEKITKQSRQKGRPTPIKTEQYALSAVIITSGVKLAIIESGRNKSLTRISPGESIDGWTLENIEPRSVLLKKGDETKNLELEVKTSKPQRRTTSNTNERTTNKTAKPKKDENTENNDNKIQEMGEKSTVKGGFKS